MCDPGAIKWIEDAFGECIITARDKWSFGVGMVSNLMWIISSSPQIYQNCKTRRVDGQSPFLFSFLLLGNVLSLIGVIITHGLLTQIITSILYCLLDGIMYAQFIYYRYIKKTHLQDQNIKELPSEPVDEMGDPIQNEEFPGPDFDNKRQTEVLGLAALVSGASATDWISPYQKDQLVGTLFGWAGGAIYLSSRIPQMMKNFKNRKVIDLSPVYVAFTIFGNLTYVLSVFIRDFSSNYLWKQAPFIFGAVGPMSCDVIFTIQMCVFGIQTGPTESKEPSLSKIEEEEIDDDEEANAEGRRLAEL